MSRGSRVSLYTDIRLTGDKDGETYDGTGQKD